MDGEIGEDGVSAAFHRRCASALTHPVTIAALVVLLVNDLVLKALWSNPWTTGKLSDLAWVIFASPLLAFILSLLTRRSRSAQRAAFVIAYIGLPLLYAAFNTFEPLHDLIIRGLLMLSGAPTGSPFDPTDSLVIPFGLSVALWVWKRVAAFATVATSYPPPPTGEVGIIDDKLIVISLDKWGGLSHMSTDGGLTWQEASDLPDSYSVQWGEDRVETPRGNYLITHGGVFVSPASYGEEYELAYSTAHLYDIANSNFRVYVAHKRYGCSYEITHLISNCPPWWPRSLIYDHTTGNVVVSAGAQGVVVGDANGNWRQVAVDELHAPVDFSIVGKVRVVFSDLTFWIAGIFFSTSATIAAITFAQLRQEMSGRHLVVGGLLGTSLALGILYVLMIFSGLSSSISPFFGYVVALALVLLLTILTILTYGSSPRRRTIRGVVPLAYSIAVSTLLVLGSSLYGINDNLGLFLSDAYIFALMFIATVSFAVSLMNFSPQRHQLPVILVALVGMIALFALAFIIGIVQYFDLIAAMLYAVILIVIASITLWFYLRRSQKLIPTENTTE